MHILMIHGGLWENVDAEQFWHRPGIASALHDAGHTVLTPDRLTRPTNWRADTDHVAAFLPTTPCALIGASNGCTIAARLAALHPHVVTSLLLAWPATCGDEERDAKFRAYLQQEGAAPDTVADLVNGQTLRGVADAALKELGMPVSVMAAPETSPAHQPHTAHRLAALTRATMLEHIQNRSRPISPNTKKTVWIRC
ncbi:MAG TPA: alpha/beta hydrolase [Candidatus Stackebrandtia faecavium]|nr:alpha/beta hydrolase [Candidatus Stackebrandtia faecavium]